MGPKPGAVGCFEGIQSGCASHREDLRLPPLLISSLMEPAVGKFSLLISAVKPRSASVSAARVNV